MEYRNTYCVWNDVIAHQALTAEPNFVVILATGGWWAMAVELAEWQYRINLYQKCPLALHTPNMPLKDGQK